MAAARHCADALSCPSSFNVTSSLPSRKPSTHRSPNSVARGVGSFGSSDDRHGHPVKETSDKSDWKTPLTDATWVK